MTFEHPAWLLWLVLLLPLALIEWRALHLRLVERVIGGHVIGTQGTPVEVLAKRIDVRYFPELWDIRNELTGLT